VKINNLFEKFGRFQANNNVKSRFFVEMRCTCNLELSETWTAACKIESKVVLKNYVAFFVRKC
jgi:hypothetical protein